MARRAIKDMAKGNGMSANAITAELILQIHQKFPFIRVWRNNRIEATVVGRGGRPRRVSAGIDGQGDICGIIGQSIGRQELGGKMLQLEVKTTERQRKAQRAFQLMIEAHGGIYLIAHDVGATLSKLQEIIGALQS